MLNSSRVMSCPSHSGSISRPDNDKCCFLREGKHGVASGKNDKRAAAVNESQILEGVKVLRSSPLVTSVTGRVTGGGGG